MARIEKTRGYDISISISEMEDSIKRTNREFKEAEIRKKQIEEKRRRGIDTTLDELESVNMLGSILSPNEIIRK